jgi:branched-chain amino acid transport system ATP-binding protein
LLEVKNVSVHYGRIQAISEVSISVEQGEVVSLIGANGAGKTTTMRAIAGLLSLSHGSITFAGENIGQLKGHQRVARGISLVPEGRGIFPAMTIMENLDMGAYGRSKKSGIAEDLERVFDLFPRLLERKTQLGGTLSGGEQQMLAIARCLMMRPKLIILDEPTEGIMPRLVSQIRREIHRINQSGVSILLVEQNVETALKLCPRVFLMEKGTIVHSGASHELKSQPEIVHRYLGLSH